MKKLLLFIFLFGCNGFDPAEIFAYPKDFSWTNVDLNGDGIGENYITPSKIQPCSDCYIYSAIGLLEIQFQIDHQTSSTLNLSEQNIHNCMGILCDGENDYVFMLNYIQKFGAMEEEYSRTGFWGKCENCKGEIDSSIGKLPIRNIPFYSFKKYTQIIFPNQPYEEKKLILVKSLQNGPVIMDIASWWGWRSMGEGTNTLYCKEENPSGHKVVIVGYENYGEYFVVKTDGDHLIKMIFEGGKKCGFAYRAHQIEKGSTFVSYGLGEKYCSSNYDVDKDGIFDQFDNCVYIPNPNQENRDGDMVGDACDPCPDDYNEKNGFYCKD